MKKFIGLWLVIFMALNLFGQHVEKKYQFGIRVSPSFNWINPETRNYKSDGGKLGFTWGLIADINLRDNYFFSTGFGLSYQGGKISYPVDYQLPKADGVGDTLILGKVYRNYNYRYLEIPLLFKMKSLPKKNIRYYGDLGLVPAFKLRTRANDIFYPAQGTTIKNEPDVSSSLNAMKLSINIGGGIEYHLDQSTFIMIGLAFNNSFTDIFSDYNSHPNVRAPEDGIANYLELSFALFL
ncbi:MAG: hypothetical protein XD81_1090 [Bacteroidetes bacterium 38_7]|nr:MAG: hypothetical protein XD81_1090 [Bacteroidetes bacterium 38_7]